MLALAMYPSLARLCKMSKFKAPLCFDRKGKSAKIGLNLCSMPINST